MEKLTAMFRSSEKEGKDEKKNDGSNQLQADIKAMGFRDAGNHKGAPEGLSQGLDNFYNNYLSSDHVNSSENARMKRKALSEKIHAANQSVTDLSGKMKLISEEKIPATLEDITEIEKEMSLIEQDMAQGKLDAGYSPFRKYLFAILSIILGIGLILFYTSLIYNALFKNLASAAMSVSSENVDDMMSAFLQVDPLFSPDLKVLVSYILAFVFIGMGVAHMLINHKNKVVKNSLIALVYFIAFGAEILFAVKMERNIHKMDSMFNAQHQAAQEGFFETALQLDVFLVIVLGFVSYIVWGLLVQGIQTENQKRNQKVSGKKMIDLKKADIRKLRKTIAAFKEEIAMLKLEISKVEQNLQMLNEQLNTVTFDRHDLLHLSGLYFEGWMKYLGLMQARPIQQNDCQDVFKNFKLNVLGKSRHQPVKESITE